MTSESDFQDTTNDSDLESHPPPEQQSLRDHVAEAMQRYFQDLGGQDTRDLYAIFMAEVEPPLLEAAMQYTRQNQSRTAELLGLNRGTLRKKLKQYNLL